MNIFTIKYAPIILVLLLVGFTLPGRASTEKEMESMLRQQQPVERLLELTQLLENQSQVEQALHICQRILKDRPDDHDILQKISYLYYRLGWLYAADGEERREYYTKFYEFAGRAQRMKPDDFYSLLLLAVAKSKNVSYLANGDQVRVARELARDVAGLVAREADNIEALYLLGWLHFEIGRVPTIKKILASVLFGGLPKEMAVEEGFSILEKLIRLKPDQIMYRYDLGIFYLRTGEPGKAQEQFEKVVSMQPGTSEGAVYHQWGRRRLGISDDDR